MKQRLRKIEGHPVLVDRLEGRRIRQTQREVLARLASLTDDELQAAINGLTDFELACAQCPRDGDMIDVAALPDWALGAVVSGEFTDELAAEVEKSALPPGFTVESPAAWVRERLRVIGGTHP